MLHRFLFGRRQGRSNVKDDLESFKGFAFKNLEEEDVYWNKLEKWTVDTCKDVCDVLDLPFPNNKNDLHSSIMDFLKNPQIRDTSDIQEEGNLQISPFSFFVREKRGELIQSNPDKSLDEIQKELLTLWDSLPNEEKLVYQSQIPSDNPTTKKRKYTRRDKKVTTGVVQTQPAKRGRKPKSAHEALTKSKEMVDDSDDEKDSQEPSADATVESLKETSEDNEKVEVVSKKRNIEDIDADDTGSSHKKQKNDNLEA
ncbi:hypothetical protein K7432_001674 [Basidiobolus ranarum]